MRQKSRSVHASQCAIQAEGLYSQQTFAEALLQERPLHDESLRYGMHIAKRRQKVNTARQYLAQR